MLGEGVAGAAEVTIVIPVRDRHAELRRCLGGLAGGASRVIVVDDCSADPAGIAAIAAEYGAGVVHRPVNGGPGAARNTGLAAAGTVLVAFLDSDCVPAAGWPDRLLPHFADPAVGAVAPRIVPHESGTSWLARYEGASSTLDMGARPSIVRPGARVSYVPGAAPGRPQGGGRRGVRRGHVRGGGRRLRLADVRRGLAGPLRAGRRHGPPAPGPAARLVRPPGRLRHLRGRARTAASRRRPAPVRLVVDRRRLGGRALPPPGRRGGTHRRRDRPARQALVPRDGRTMAAPGHHRDHPTSGLDNSKRRGSAAWVLDDAAYSLGVWKGCARRRTIRPLLPAIGSGPGGSRGR